MDGYSRSDLERMLASGDPIEARCSLCDEIWVFSEQDRAAVRYSLGKL
jgi:redox-regulated HSP33 family molecular chaperone